MGVSAYRTDTACQFLRWKTGREQAEGKELRRDGGIEAPGKVFPLSWRECSAASFSLLPQRSPQTPGDRWGTERMSDTLGLY